MTFNSALKGIALNDYASVFDFPKFLPNAKPITIHKSALKLIKKSPLLGDFYRVLTARE